MKDDLPTWLLGVGLRYGAATAQRSPGATAMALSSVTRAVLASSASSS